MIDKRIAYRKNFRIGSDEGDVSGREYGGSPSGTSSTGTSSNTSGNQGNQNTNRERGILSQYTGPQKTTGNITNFIDTGPDRSSVSQFSTYGKNLFNQNLKSLQPTLGQKLGGLGGTILSGILGLINPVLGFLSRGITSAPNVFDKFKSSKTLEEFRDKLRGYGKTMPTYSNNPAFGGIESLITTPTVNDSNNEDNEVEQQYGEYLIDAPPQPLTFEQFKNAIDSIKQGTPPNTSTSMLPANNLVVGLTKKQKELLDKRRGMLDVLGDEAILDTIKSEDDPNDPATLEDVRKYYGIV